MNEKNGELLSVKGENAFAKICNNLGCEHLHIRQEPEEFSRKMGQTGQKRPDFLINIQDLTSLFVDVKVRDRKPAGQKNPELKTFKAFSVDVKDYLKMRELERRMRISTWYAFIEQNGSTDVFGSPAYMVPISRAEKNMPDHVRKMVQNGVTDIDWEIRIPFCCMNEWASVIDLSDKCRGCPEYCKHNSK